uniref:Cytochrome P450 CYP736A12-like n=1 Tax=Nelumbo nucifera TaxID=4432 RepID=A0A822YT83_NELNU|nr:TPA_asm: hypothetical protein HUJ06_005953 [Nelumbo nucifera]
MFGPLDGTLASVWSENADQEFIPERFMGTDVDLRGRDHFQLLPFGSGRRSCPGMQLGLTVIRLQRLPPGPPGLPVLGNLHMLGQLPHRDLHRLANKYGPIMYMRLGLVPTVVVSSPEAAALFLKTHDLAFASRPTLKAFEYMAYGSKGLAFSKYGPYWRFIRRLCTTELFTDSKVHSFKATRKEEFAHFCTSLKQAAEADMIVDLKEKI